MSRFLRGLRALIMALGATLSLSALTTTEAEAQTTWCGWGSIRTNPCPAPGDTIFTQTSDSKTFSVVNQGYNDLWIVEPLCTGAVTSCWVDDPFLYLPWGGWEYVTLYYGAGPTSGPGDATLRIHDGGYDEHTTTVDVTVWDRFTVDVAQPSPRLHPLDVCDSGCFTAWYTHSTVPYMTLNTPRSVTLVYDGERAHPLPFLEVDVTLMPGALAAKGFDLAAQFTGGANLTFMNGTTHQVAAAGTSISANMPIRLWGQVDMRGYSSGRYPITVTVTVTYTNNTTEVRTINTALIVANDGNSAFAKGWSVAGIQRLYFPPSGGYLAIENGGPAVYFTSLNSGERASDRSWLSYDAATQRYIRWYLDGSKVTFLANGTMYEAITRTGRRTRYAFHPTGYLQAVYEPTRIDGGVDNLYYEFLYSGGTTGTLTTIRERKNSWIGRATTYTVTAAGITAITDPDGYHTDFTYDASGRLKTITDRKGATRTIGYDAVSWLVRWDSLPAVPIDNGNGTATLGYPAVQYSPWQAVGNGSTAILRRDYATGSVTDPIGRTTGFLPNAWGQQLFVTRPDGYTQITRDAQRRPIQIRDGNVRLDSLVYNDDHQVIAHYPWQQVGSPIFYRYGPYGQVDSLWGPATRTERRFINLATGNVDSVKLARPNGQQPGTIRYTYDSWGRVASVKDEANHITYTHYDPVHWNADSTLAPGSRWTRTRFDVYGRDSTATGAGQATTTIYYDAMNRRTHVYDGVNGTPIRYFYDPLYQVAVRNTKGELADSAAHNALGWVATRYDTYNPALALTYRYDKAGRLTSYTNRRGQRVSLTYDVRDQVTSKSGDNTTTDSLTADAFGYWTAKNAHARLDGYRDPVTGASDIKTYFGTTMFRAVDAMPPDFAGTRTVTITTTVSGLTFKQRVFNPDATTGLRASMNVGSGTTMSFKYNSDRLRDTTTYQGQAYKRLEAYTSLHRRNEMGYTNFTAIDTLFRRRYHYDALGRVDQRLAIGNGGTVTQHRYQYDMLGRLQTAEERTGCGSATTDSTSGFSYSCSTVVSSTTYSYDAVGNRTDNSGSYAAGNRILQFKGYTFEHDADGNVTRKYRTSAPAVDRRYTWSAEGLLLQVKDALTNDSVTFGYDGLKRPVIRKTNGTIDRYWVYDNRDQLLIELDGSFNRIADYAYDPGVDRPLMTMTGAQTPLFRNYHVVDELGNVIGQHGDYGIVQHTTYDPWGVPNTSYSTENKLLWKGLHHERGGALGWTGLYYMRARWYDPELSRFLTEDPIGLEGGINAYEFAKGDPINFSDALGLCREPVGLKQGQIGICIETFIQGGLLGAIGGGDDRSSSCESDGTYRTGDRFIFDPSTGVLSENELDSGLGWTFGLFQGYGYVRHRRGVAWGEVHASAQAFNGLWAPPYAISYDFTLSFSADGDVLVSGMHDGFPSYEICIYEKGKKPRSIYTHSESGNPLDLRPPMDVKIP